MTWDTPTLDEIACGMEVTAYAPAEPARQEEPSLEATAQDR